MVTPVDGGNIAHCSGCYSDSPKAVGTRRLRATADTEERAIEEWLELARAAASVGLIPRMSIPYTLATPVISEVLEQAVTEFDRQRGFRLVNDTITLALWPGRTPLMLELPR
jgi:hypothetical protein